MITLNELENGNLEIVLTDREELQEAKDKGLFDNNMVAEMLETAHYIGNDWHVPNCIGLTEAPAIGYGQLQDEADENEMTDDYEKVWYYQWYMVRDFSDELLKEGRVTFIKAQDSTTENETHPIKKIKQDKFDSYLLYIEVNGITFESESIWRVPQIAKKFSISIKTVLNLIK